MFVKPAKLNVCTLEFFRMEAIDLPICRALFPFLSSIIVASNELYVLSRNFSLLKSDNFMLQQLLFVSALIAPDNSEVSKEFLRALDCREISSGKTREEFSDLALYVNF